MANSFSVFSYDIYDDPINVDLLFNSEDTDITCEIPLEAPLSPFTLPDDKISLQENPLPLVPHEQSSPSVPIVTPIPVLTLTPPPAILGNTADQPILRKRKKADGNQEQSDSADINEQPAKKQRTDTLSLEEANQFIQLIMNRQNQTKNRGLRLNSQEKRKLTFAFAVKRYNKDPFTKKESDLLKLFQSQTYREKQHQQKLQDQELMEKNQEIHELKQKLAELQQENIGLRTRLLCVPQSQSLNVASPISQTFFAQSNVNNPALIKKQLHTQKPRNNQSQQLAPEEGATPYGYVIIVDQQPEYQTQSQPREERTHTLTRSGNVILNNPNPPPLNKIFRYSNPQFLDPNQPQEVQPSSTITMTTAIGTPK